MDEKRLSKALTDISKIRVAVIGDFCIDAYWLLDMSKGELSLETGKTTWPVSEQRYSLGGAANVANNLISLDVKQVLAIGIIGDDLFGRELTAMLSRIKVNTDGLFIQSQNCSTPVFGKPYQNDEEKSRIDFGMLNQIHKETQAKLLRYIQNIIDSVQAVIINQQLINSIYSDDFIEKINQIILRYPDKYFIVDNRSQPEKFRNVYLKLNQTEAARINNIEKEPDKAVPLGEIRGYARNIYNMTNKPVFITRGNRGIFVYDGKQHCEIPGIKISKNIDPVGAGDAAVSAISAALAAGLKPEEAAEIANLVSAVTIQKLLCCGTATAQEILEINQAG